MYITRVRARGWQSHADTTIQFGPGLNALTGASEAGKTAILRIAKWVLWNESPEGPVTDWIRNGETLTAGTVEFDTGTEITRERSNGRNRYTLNQPGAEPLKLADFGESLPPQIAAAHGLLPLVVSGEPYHLHYAAQMDPAWFLSATAPQRARFLGNLSGVGVIDLAMKSARADVQKIAIEVTRLEAEVTRLDGQLARYDDLDEQESQVGAAEMMLAKLPVIGQRIIQLQGIKSARQRALDDIAIQAAILDRLHGVDQAATLLAGAELAHNRAGQLTTIRERCSAAHTGQRVAQSTLQATTGVEAARQNLERITAAGQRREQLQRIASAKLQAVTGQQAARQVLERTTGIDLTVTVLQTIITNGSRQQSLQRVAGNLSTARQGIAAARPILTRTAGVHQARTAVAAILTAIDRRYRLLKTATAIAAARSGAAAAQRILAQTAGLPVAVTTLAEIDRIRTTRQRLAPLRDRAFEARSYQIRAVQAVDRLSWVPQAQTLVVELDPLRHRLFMLRNLRVRRWSISEQVAGAAQNLSEAASRFSTASGQYITAFKEAKICPTCKTPLSDHTVAQLAAELNTEVHTDAA